MSRLRAAGLAAACTSLLHGCVTSDEVPKEVPTPSGALFVSDVYPLLLRNCAFSNCHGARDRFLRVYGPGRTRMRASTPPDDDMTLDEVIYSYERARSMLATSDHAELSLLLTKPVELEAGGQGHEGIDEYGRNAFASRRDAGFALLLRWAQSTGTAPTAEDVDAAIETAREPLP
jgi:hypothetical protein